MIPNALDAEITVLKLCIDDRDNYQEAKRYLTPRDFSGRNSSLFEAIGLTESYSHLAEQVVTNHVKGWDPAGFSLIIDEMALPSMLPGALKVLQNRAVRRRVLKLGAEIVEQAQKHVNVEELRSIAENIIIATEQANKDGLRHVSEILSELLDDLEEGHKRYIPTGYQKVDRILTGFYNQDLVILAARPSMGKTAFAGNLACKIAAQGYPVAFFSLEMEDQSIVGRILSSFSGVNSNKIRAGSVYDTDWKNLEKGANTLHALPLHIDDRGGLKVAELRATAKEWKRKHEGRILFVDYLQLMTAAGRSNNEIVGNISKGLKALAKELDLPIVALSQLSREVRNRQDKRPQLSDLRDSGAIEQDADTVMFLHRESYYSSDRKDGPTELIIAKQRNGPVGTADLDFDGSIQTFK